MAIYNDWYKFHVYINFILLPVRRQYHQVYVFAFFSVVVAVVVGAVGQLAERPVRWVRGESQKAHLDRYP